MNKIEDWKAWLKFSKEDLESAVILSKTENKYPRNVCYFCQQSTEEAIKSIYVYYSLSFRKSHDLDFLFKELPLECKNNLALNGLTELTEWQMKLDIQANIYY